MGGKSGGGSAKTQVTDYYMSIHMGICAGPVDAIEAIIIGEKEAWTGSAATETTLSVSKTDLFGGNKKEGGVAGDIYLTMGEGPEAGLLMPSGLASRLGTTPDQCPAYNGLATAFFTGSGGRGFLWSSNSPYLKSTWFKVRRRSNTFSAGFGFPSNYANMGSESNPAHIIYECLTNEEWGMGAPANIIDTESFLYAAKVFYDEGLGLSLMWTEQATIEAFITEIIDHVQATFFINPLTGLLTLKPVRDDYDPEDLPELNPNNCKITKFARRLWGETVNEINVTWTNPETESEETVTIHDLANIEMQGSLVSDSRNYYGVRSAALAMKLAARDIRTAAAPLASFEIECDRSMWTLLPGSCVRLVYPEYGIEGLVLRVGNIDYGKPGDSTIRLSTMEDIFGLPQSAYTVPDESGWESQSKPPSDMEYVNIITMPYYFATQVAAAAGLSTTETEYPNVLAGVLAATSNDDTNSFDIYSEATLPTGEVEMTSFGTRPVATTSSIREALVAEASTTATGAELGIPNMTNGVPPYQSGFAVIGDIDRSDEELEFVLITNITGDYASITMQRGVLDTVPRDWPYGTKIWFIGEGTSWGCRALFTDGGTGKFKLLPTTSQGQLDLADATEHLQVMTDRPHAPFRPANVKINGQGFGVVFQSTTDDFSVTWSRRNRLTEDSQVLAWTEADVLPEDGQTTKITVLDVDRNVLTTHAGLTGTSFTLPYASLGGESVAIVRVTAERDGFESIQGHEFYVSDGTGYGTNYGNDYGGT